MQPPVKPRPDVESLPLNYRRIPILAHHRTLYLDSRLILSKLESQFPASATPQSFLHPVPPTREAAALVALLASWTQDGGVFARGAQLIPLSSPVLRDQRFVKDREGYSGRSWNRERMAQLRGENMVAVRKAFAVVEELLGDGREWVLGTKGMTIADLEG
jgi:glutathione S-transferase